MGVLVKFIILDCDDADEIEREIPVDRPEFLIGRAVSCDLAIENIRVGMKHCRIARKDNHLVIEDLHSTYGTAVNGRTVAGAGLRDGDLIQVSPATLLVAVGSAPSETRRRTRAAVVALRARGGTASAADRGRDPNEDTPLVRTAQRIFDNLAVTGRTRGASEPDRSAESPVSDDTISTELAAPPAGRRRRGCLHVLREQDEITLVELPGRAIITARTSCESTATWTRSSPTAGIAWCWNSARSSTCPARRRGFCSRCRGGARPRAGC